MAILHEQVLPEGVTLEFVAEVNKELNATGDPPAGLIVHTSSLQDGRVRIVDVWESVETHDAFGMERLLPAIQKVAERHGMSTDVPMEVTITEVAEVVRGKS